MSVTYDISDFGYREIEETENLFREYRTGDGAGLGNGVKVAFNTMSGYVFLTDEDYNCAMLNDEGRLEKWVICSNCGHEDFISNFECKDEEIDAGHIEYDEETFICPECDEEVY